MPIVRDEPDAGRTHPCCLGCIADDLTGATDLALMLTRAGMRTVQIMQVPDAGSRLDGFDAVVVALKTRTCPVAEAVALSLKSADALLALGARQLFFKYCSTFDSTDQGNIGPVAEALLARTSQRIWRSPARHSRPTSAPSTWAICSSATCRWPRAP